MKKNISNCLAISKKNVTFAVELRFLQVETRNLSTTCSFIIKRCRKELGNLSTDKLLI